MENENLEEKIIHTARQVFIEKGYECASMSDIAARVGINRPTLHYYFRTKERMFQAIIKEVVDSIFPHMQNIISNDADFFDKLSSVLDQYIITFKKNPDLPIFLIKESQRDVKLLIDTAREMHFDQLLKQIENVINKEMEEGRLRQIKIEYIFSTFYGLMTFPFIGKIIIKEIILNGSEVDYNNFLDEWKSHIITQMKALLVP